MYFRNIGPAKAINEQHNRFGEQSSLDLELYHSFLPETSGEASSVCTDSFMFHVSCPRLCPRGGEFIHHRWREPIYLERFPRMCPGGGIAHTTLAAAWNIASTQNTEHRTQNTEHRTPCSAHSPFFPRHCWPPASNHPSQTAQQLEHTQSWPRLDWLTFPEFGWLE